MTRASQTELLPSLDGLHVPAGFIVDQGVKVVLSVVGLLAVAAAIFGTATSGQEFAQVSGRIVRSITGDSAVAVLQIQGSEGFSGLAGMAIEISSLGDQAVHRGGQVLRVLPSSVPNLPSAIGAKTQYQTLIEAKLDVSGVWVDTTTRVIGRVKIDGVRGAQALLHFLRSRQ